MDLGFSAEKVLLSMDDIYYHQKSVLTKLYSLITEVKNSYATLETRTSTATCFEKKLEALLEHVRSGADPNQLNGGWRPLKLALHRKFPVEVIQKLKLAQKIPGTTVSRRSKDRKSGVTSN